MAKFQSDLAAGQSAKGDNRVDGRLLAGKVRQANATITLDGAESGGDIIELVDIPKGALLDLESSFIYPNASVGTALEVILRDGSEQNLTTDIVLTGATAPVVIGGGLVEVESAKTSMDLLVTTGTSVSGGVKVRVCLQYVDYN